MCIKSSLQGVRGFEMNTFRCLLFLLLLFFVKGGEAQYLSHLEAMNTDALYTTYAAAPERSHYKTDQGYQFQWFDDESGVEFISKDGPNIGCAFQVGNRLIFRLGELNREPVVTTSYSDLVKYFYYPVNGLRVEAIFAVYSSETAVLQYRLVNEGRFPLDCKVLPYLYYPSGDSLHGIEHQSGTDGFAFQLTKKRDGWMIEHHIPVVENLSGYWASSLGFDSVTTFTLKDGKVTERNSSDILTILKQTFLLQKHANSFIHGLFGFRTLHLQPGESTSFHVTIDLTEQVIRESRLPLPAWGGAGGGLLSQLLKSDELAYSKIPKLAFTGRDQEMLYWSAFSLMRQCMMPPEGECRHNYYVFSREPKWGWGYGGQVFHESLTMMAYARMDPQGAMNSQRIFMDRQRPDGYINYRTGPYLDETIETSGQPTTSAPWFNYENLEIYKITGDRQFLKDAYASGSRFYQYYVSNRDSNHNGLCEWGAQAELESVRDARVAVWDKVGWAANFEGPDLNSMLVMEAKSLAEMAKQLELPEESKAWQQDAAHRGDLINRSMWDQETGFYYNVNKKDQSFSFNSPNDLKIKEIIGFLPLWAGVADKIKAKLLVEKMQDTSEFWRPYGVPSLSAADKYYCPIGYWNGPVWVQWEYLLYKGLRANGYDQVAGQLASRVLDNMIFHLKNDHEFWEFYSADDRQAGWNKTYIWAGIAVEMMIH